MKNFLEFKEAFDILPKDEQIKIINEAYQMYKKREETKLFELMDIAKSAYYRNAKNNTQNVVEQVKKVKSDGDLLRDKS